MDKAANNAKLRVWHWNANGLRCRKALLQQQVQSMAAPPDVIMIQETHMEETPKLPGYHVHASPPSARTSNTGAAQGVCTFVRKGITLIKLDRFLDGNTALELCATEVVVGKKTQESVCLMNAYSNPQHRSQRFRTLFQKARRKAVDMPIIVAGDFNSSHRELGYPRTTAKGRSLLDEAEEAEFELLSDPQRPSRIGTSATRDTTPDLAFVHLPDDRPVGWRNTGLNLGSDHYIIEVELPLRVRSKQAPTRKHKLTDWNAFRRQEIAPTIEDLEKWTRSLVDAVARVSTEVETDESIPTMDPRLAHLIEARQSLQRRWKRMRHNRTLRKRIAHLGREIEKYSTQLCVQQWHAICNEADGQLHASRTWKLLRHLRDETQSKSFQQHRLAQILHAAIKEHGEDEVGKRLIDQYLPATAQVRHPDYEGTDNPALDADIEEWEVRRAVQELNCKSAAGPDLIHNKTLRNLGDVAITALTNFYNDCWRSGTLPKQWRTARTILIPKPNKPPSIENLRPISLTSCAGKVLEHVLNNRWQSYMEEHDAYPAAMLGFRARLSTQDAMLLIQHDLLESPSKTDCRAILGLDLKSAFDNVLHSAILAQVERLGLGRRTYDYIRAFLSNRTACLHVGHLQLEERRLGSVGTPQGAVISPFLFNIVMIPVAERLARLPQVQHTIYADDITLWMTGGTTGHIEESLQEAIWQIEDCLRGTGLRCSPQKSELLILPPPGHWRKSTEKEAANITLRTEDGTTIPHVRGIRVLGMHFDAGNGNHTALSRLLTKVGVATRLVKQISTKRHGMRETNLLRLLQSFVTSHVSYVGAFHGWLRHEREKINAAIRKAHKTALGLLASTSNDALARLGVHNTLEEVSEAQRTTQLTRLATTKAGRAILQRVGLRPPRAESYWEEAPKREEVSKQVARRLVVLPLPRNVHPDRNKERRVARARALAETYADDAKAVYVDAAKHQRKPKTYVAAVVRATDGKVLNACSVRATSAEQAEEAAIALALSGIPEATTILSDSRTAIANFGRGSVGTPAASLLPRTKSTTTHLRWFPAHVGVIPGGAANRNEEADVVARELAYRAAPPRPSEADEADFLDPDPLLDYGGILAWYREGRRALPGPHPRLGRREGVLLRQLQTGTVLTPALARHVCPGLFESATCSVCARELATLAHVLWGCDACAGGTVRDSLPPDMEHYISSPDHQAQLQAIQRLDAALARQKRTEATPSS